MKLYIEDSGDPTVGIAPTVYTVECPFGKDAAKAVRESFLTLLKRLYGLYADGKLTGRYEDELTDD